MKADRIHPSHQLTEWDVDNPDGFGGHNGWRCTKCWAATCIHCVEGAPSSDDAELKSQCPGKPLWESRRAARLDGLRLLAEASRTLGQFLATGTRELARLNSQLSEMERQVRDTRLISCGPDGTGLGRIISVGQPEERN